MRILVTGANGQLGQCLQEKMIIDTDNTWIFTTHESLDITNGVKVNSMIESLKIDIVVNCAAYTNVDKAESDINTAWKINSFGVGLLADICRKNNVKLIHISTDYVFNGKKNTPYDIDDECSPTNIYGKTKRLGEEMIINSGCNYLIFRTSWLYSEYGNNFVKKMVNNMMLNKELKVVYDQVGSPTYANELAMFIWYIIENNYLDKNGIYHFANKGIASWYDIVHVISKNDEIQKLYSKEIKPCLSSEWATSVKRPNYSVLNTSKIEIDFKWRIHNWQDMLELAVNRIIRKNESN